MSRYATKTEHVRALLAAGEAPADAAKRAKVSVNYVYQLRWNDKQKKVKTKDKVGLAQNVLLKTPRIVNQLNVGTDVANPEYYKIGGIETIDFIEAKRLNFNLGNVVGYVARADHKGDALADLKKAVWYLNREVAKREGAAG